VGAFLVLMGTSKTEKLFNFYRSLVKSFKTGGYTVMLGAFMGVYFYNPRLNYNYLIDSNMINISV